MLDEIADKLASMTAPPEATEEKFLARVTDDRIRAAHALLAELAGGRTTDAYVGHAAHTVRIASYVHAFQVPPDPETVRIALLHNVMEVCGATPEGLAARGVTAREIDAVQHLTIDRAHESDPVYLAEFYGAIEAFGPDLSLVRCLDKLDNLLGIRESNTGPVFISYVALARQFVLPMAARLDATLAAFFDEVSTFMAKRART